MTAHPQQPRNTLQYYPIDNRCQILIAGRAVLEDRFGRRGPGSVGSKRITADVVAAFSTGERTRSGSRNRRTGPDRGGPIGGSMSVVAQRISHRAYLTRRSLAGDTTRIHASFARSRDTDGSTRTIPAHADVDRAHTKSMIWMDNIFNNLEGCHNVMIKIRLQCRYCEYVYSRLKHRIWLHKLKELTVLTALGKDAIQTADSLTALFDRLGGESEESGKTLRLPVQIVTETIQYST